MLGVLELYILQQLQAVIGNAKGILIRFFIDLITDKKEIISFLHVTFLCLSPLDFPIFLHRTSEKLTVMVMS